jgi:hypothetical protein
MSRRVKLPFWCPGTYYAIAKPYIIKVTVKRPKRKPEHNYKESLLLSCRKTLCDLWVI